MLEIESRISSLVAIAQLSSVVRSFVSAPARGWRPRQPSALVDEGLEAVGAKVAGQGLEQAGELLHRGGEGTGQLGQQHLAGLDVGQGRASSAPTAPCRP